MTEKEFRAFNTETGRYRHLTAKHCVGNGIDIGSGGDPVVNDAIQIELPLEEYNYYHTADAHPNPASCYRGHADNLPFKDRTLDYVYSSHLLEDFLDWKPYLKEWTRVLRKGGRLIILIPDKKLWEEDLKRGRTPNCSHKHEGYVGELSTYAKEMGWKVEEDKLTAVVPIDYTIIFRATKL